MKNKSINVTVVIVILLTIGLLVSHFLLSNKAQRQSSFITQYAKQQGLIQFRATGDSGQGPDNSTPWYEIYYETGQSTSSIKTNLEVMLKAKGYTVHDNLFNPEPCLSPSGDISYGGPGCPDSGLSGSANNGSRPYWVIKGSGPINTISAEITDISYSDTSYTHNLYKDMLGQHPVPSGHNVLDITISSN